MAFARGPLIISSLAIACALAAFGWKMGEWLRDDSITTLSFDHTQESRLEDPVDSDHDGLPDWQEEILGTDRTTQDQNPEAILAAFQSLHNGSSTEDGPSITGSIGARIASQVASLKENGEYTPEKGLAIADAVLNEVSATASFTPYPESSFAPTVPPTADNVRTYSSVMQTALSPLTELPGTDFILFANYLYSGKTDSLDEMRRRATLYSSIARSLILIRAPRDIATDHQRLANGLLYFQSVTTQMTQRADDPLATLALIRAYNEAERYLGEQLWIVDRYITQYDY